jgi:hypothetical protein
MQRKVDENIVSGAFNDNLKMGILAGVAFSILLLIGIRRVDK